KADCLHCHEDAKIQVAIYQGKKFDHKSHGAGDKIQCSTCHASDIKQSFKTDCGPCHHHEKEIAAKISRVAAEIPELPATVYCESCHPIQTAMYKGSRLIASLRLQQRLPSMKFDAKVDCIECHKFDHFGKMTLESCDAEGCHKEQPLAPLWKGEGDYAAIMDTWQAKTRTSIAQAEILEQKIEKLLTDWDVPEAKQLYENAKEALDSVRKDGSLGVHNPELVDKLMNNSIEQFQQSLQLLMLNIQG
ncbi:MAG: cytochrome c3 family protein, partial [Candidatus Poribacteria bacterium]